MKNKIDNWELVITPRWVNKQPKTKQVKCYTCDGTGTIPKENDDSFGIGSSPNEVCFRCCGFKTLEVPDIEKSPEITNDFLEALRKFMNEYPWEN